MGAAIKKMQRDSIDNVSRLSFDKVFPYLVPVLLPIAQICLVSSIYVTVAVAVERFFCVCR